MSGANLARVVIVTVSDTRTSADDASGDALVEGSDLPTRGFLRMAGVVRLGDAAPQAWREEARALTLPWSRPYLRP